MSKPSKVRFTLRWNCSQIFFIWRSIKCRRRLKLFVDLLDSLEQGSTSEWMLMTPMLAPANSALVCWLCWLCCVVEITLTGASEFYYPDELYGNELVFVLSFVSSNNWMMKKLQSNLSYCTEGMFVISLLQLLPETWRKRLYRTLFSSRCFLAFDPRSDKFFDYFNWKKFRLKTVCLF